MSNPHQEAAPMPVPSGDSVPSRDPVPPRDIVVIAHNMRSAYNVGSLLRTADAFAVSTVYCTGYTPYPPQEQEIRPEALVTRLAHRIHKSALGAEHTVRCRHHPGIAALLNELHLDGYQVAGLEVGEETVPLSAYRPPQRVAVLLGAEVEGIPAALRSSCDTLLRIAMFGSKSSLNVSVAAGVALHALRQSG